MSWNLQSELNTDFSTDSLFDDLPPAPVELTRQGESRTKISDVPRLSSKPLEIGAAGEAFLGAETFGQKQTPKVEAAPVESAPVQEEKEWTLGRWFNTVRSAAQKLDSLQKIGDVGPNAARGYNRAYFESLKSALKQHMAERVETEFGYEQPEVMRLYDFLTRDSAGYRSQEDIDEIHSYVKNGVEVNGSFQSPTWDEAVLIQKAQRHERLKEKTTGGDPMKAVSDAQAALKPIIDESGNPLPGKEAQFEKLNGIIDSALQLPTGVYAYSDQYSRLSDRENKLKLAYANGINFGGVAKDNIPQEIVNLNEQKVALAVERAPTFNMSEPNDKVKMQDWLAKGETKNLLFNAILDDGSIATFEPTNQENIYRRWSPTEKQWKIANFNKPQDNPVSEKPETNSEFSKAGQAGQKIRRAASKIAVAAESGVAKAGAAVADLLPLSVNTGASVIEGAAGVFDTPLKLDRMDYLEERAKKNKVGKYRDK